MRYGHLGDVDEHLEIATCTSDGGGGDGRLEVSGGDAHAEVHSPATLHGTRDVFGASQIADDDFGAASTERCGTLIVAADQSADRQAAFEQQFGDRAAHAADAAGSAGDEDRIRRCSWWRG